MTPIEIEVMVRNLNNRLTDVEQILPTLATRDDVKNGIETLRQESASNLAALEKRLRDDLASKSDLADLEKRLREDLASKSDLASLERRLREELASKKDLEELRKELGVRFDEAKNYALVLHEDLKSDISLIAEHLVDVMSRLPPRSS
jgi:hypothetical protein